MENKSLHSKKRLLGLLGLLKHLMYLCFYIYTPFRFYYCNVSGFMWKGGSPFGLVLINDIYFMFKKSCPFLYCLAKKSCTILFSGLLCKMGQDFLDIQNIASLHMKMDKTSCTHREWIIVMNDTFIIA